MTRNGVPIGDLVPARRQQFVRAESVLAAFASLAPVDYERFLADLDGVLDQDPSPSG